MKPEDMEPEEAAWIGYVRLGMWLFILVVGCIIFMQGCRECSWMFNQLQR